MREILIQAFVLPLLGFEFSITMLPLSEEEEKTQIFL